MEDLDPLRAHQTQRLFSEIANNSPAMQITTSIESYNSIETQNISVTQLGESLTRQQIFVQYSPMPSSSPFDHSDIQKAEFQVQNCVQLSEAESEINQTKQNQISLITTHYQQAPERIIPQMLIQLQKLPYFSMDMIKKIAKERIQTLENLFRRYHFPYIEEIQTLNQKYAQAPRFDKKDLQNLQLILKQTIFGLDQTQLAKRLKQLKKQQLPKYKDVIILDGPGGTGKTAVLAGLAGKDMDYYPQSSKSHHQAKLIRHRQRYNIKKNQTYTHLNKSKTSRNFSSDSIDIFDITIAKYDSKDMRLEQISFEDEIANVFYINEELTKIQKLRLGIVLSANYFGERTKKPFQHLIRHYAKVFENIPNAKKSFFIILTKGLKVSDLIKKLHNFLEKSDQIFSDQEQEFIQSFKNKLYSYDNLIRQNKVFQDEKHAVMEIFDPVCHNFRKLTEFILSQESAQVKIENQWIELNPLCLKKKKLSEQYLLTMIQRTLQCGDHTLTKSYVTQLNEFDQFYYTKTDIKQFLKKSMTQNMIIVNDRQEQRYNRLVQIKNLLTSSLLTMKSSQNMMKTIFPNQDEFDEFYCEIAKKKTEEAFELMNQQTQMFLKYENIFFKPQSFDLIDAGTKLLSALSEFYQQSSKVWNSKVQQVCQKTLSDLKGFLIQNSPQDVSKIKTLAKKYLTIPATSYVVQNQRTNQLCQMYRSYWLSSSNVFYQEINNNLEQLKSQNLLLPGKLREDLQKYLEKLVSTSKNIKIFTKIIPSIKAQLILKINQQKQSIDSQLKLFDREIHTYFFKTQKLKTLVNNQAQLLQAVWILEDKEFDFLNYVDEKIKSLLCNLKNDIQLRVCQLLHRNIQLSRDRLNFYHPQIQISPNIDNEIESNLLEDDISSIKSRCNCSHFFSILNNWDDIKGKPSHQIAKCLNLVQSALAKLSKVKEIVEEVYLNQIPLQLTDFSNSNLIPIVHSYFQQIETHVDRSSQFQFSNRLIQNDSYDIYHQSFLITSYMNVEKLRTISETFIEGIYEQGESLLTKIRLSLMESLTPSECYDLQELNYSLTKFINNTIHINDQVAITQKQFSHQSNLKNIGTQILQESIQKKFAESIHLLLGKFIKKPMTQSLIELLNHQENLQISLKNDLTNQRTQSLISTLLATQGFSISKMAHQIKQLQETSEILKNFSQIRIVRSIVYKEIVQVDLLTSKIRLRLNKLANKLLDPSFVQRMPVKYLLTLEKQFNLLLNIDMHLQNSLNENSPHQQQIEQKDPPLYKNPYVWKLLNFRLKIYEENFSQKLGTIQNQFQDPSSREKALSQLSNALSNPYFNDERFNHHFNQLFHTIFHALHSDILNNYYKSPTCEQKVTYLSLLSICNKVNSIFEKSKYSDKQNIEKYLDLEYCSFKRTFGHFLRIFCEEIEQIDEKLKGLSFPVLKEKGHVYLQKSFKNVLVALSKLELSGLYKSQKFSELDQSLISQISQIEIVQQSSFSSINQQMNQWSLVQSQFIEEQNQLLQLQPILIGTEERDNQKVSLIPWEQESKAQLQKQIQQTVISSFAYFDKLEENMTQITKRSTELYFGQSRVFQESKMYEENRMKQEYGDYINQPYQNQISAGDSFSFYIDTNSFLSTKPQNKIIVHLISTEKQDRYSQNLNCQSAHLEFKVNQKGHLTCQIQTSFQARFHHYQELA